MPTAYDLKDRNRVADLSINATTATGTATITEGGEYTIYCKDSVDCFVRVGATANNTMPANSQRLISGNMVEVIVEKGQKIWAMCETGTATLEICKVRANIYY